MDKQEVLEKIKKLASEIKRDVNLMEVCGTHTQAISRHGIRNILPKNINLITGPGCPVADPRFADVANVEQGISSTWINLTLRVPLFDISITPDGNNLQQLSSTIVHVQCPLIK